jgi:hypothetical protein
MSMSDEGYSRKVHWERQWKNVLIATNLWMGFYWSGCTKHRKWAVMYLYVMGINIVSFFLRFWYVLELLRQCGIFFLCFSFKHYIYTILAPVEFSAPDELNVPHSLTLIEDLDQICVADREHGR